MGEPLVTDQIMLVLAAEAANLPALRASFDEALAAFLGGEAAEAVVASESPVRVVERDSGPVFYAEREYLITPAA